jgi:HrpA-like RNA helicase
MSDFDFQPYLSAIVVHYAKDDRFYTPTDALLPLEVRTVERQEKEGQEKRVEQFPVLEGLRKYALGERREHVLVAGRPGSGKSTAGRQQHWYHLATLENSLGCSGWLHGTS